MKLRRHVTTVFIGLLSMMLIPGLVSAAGSQEQKSRQTESVLVQQTDIEIEEDVRDRLKNHPEIPEDEITVVVENQTVTLSGTVSEFSDVALAGTITDNVFGVVDVENTLEVEPTEDMVSGDTLKGRVKGLLDRDPILSEKDIQVKVIGSSVTLEGTVDSVYAKELASNEVEDITGVSELNNELAVVPGEDVKDEMIAQDLQDAIDIETSTDAENIEITVENGKVTLEGSVDTFEAKDDVEELAKQTSGVIEVSNNLTVPTPSIAELDDINVVPTDPDIRSDVVKLLDHDIIVEKSEVDVTVINGVVTLSGTVDSYIEKNEAVDTAWSVFGVDDVKDRLVVGSGEIEDDPLAQDVRDALMNRSSIDLPDFEVEVENGIVTITGSTESSWEKHQATDIVESIIGVIEVKNLLTVVPENEVEDELLASDVVNALKDHRKVEPEDITVRVDDGTVTLTGSVDSYDARETAESIVQTIPGVIIVENELDVS